MVAEDDGIVAENNPIPRHDVVREFDDSGENERVQPGVVENDRGKRSIFPASCTASNSADLMRKSSLASNATEVDHVEPNSPLESPSKYSAFSTSPHQSLVSPGKSKYCALATVDSV